MTTEVMKTKNTKRRRSSATTLQDQYDISKVEAEVIAATGTLVAKAVASMADTFASSMSSFFAAREHLNHSIIEEARKRGYFEGEKSEHVSFRTTPALIEAAKKETGIESTSELGTLALAMLAQPDPVASVMKRTRGRLGKDHSLEY